MCVFLPLIMRSGSVFICILVAKVEHCQSIFVNEIVHERAHSNLSNMDTEIV